MFLSLVVALGTRATLGQEAFDAWVGSQSFADGHRSAVERAGGEAPKPVSTHSEVWSYETAGGSTPR